MGSLLISTNVMPYRAEKKEKVELKNKNSLFQIHASSMPELQYSMKDIRSVIRYKIVNCS